MNEQAKSELRILKIDDCASLSGRTRITYHVGVRGKDDICFRIWATSGKGVFSKEWVCASAIHKLLAQHEVLCAPTMLPLFQVGRSVNTGGYLLAVLKEEGLVALSPDLPHKYVRVQSQAFVAEVAALIKNGIDLDPTAPTVATAAGKGKRSRDAVPAWELEGQELQVQSE